MGQRHRAPVALVVALVAVLLSPIAVAGASPDAVDDGFAVGVDAPMTTLAVLANDDGDLTITGVTDPAHGTATIDGSGIDYTPDAAFHGTDAFDYTVEDGSTATDTATVTVVVDDPPVAVNDPGAACVQPPSAYGGGVPVPEDEHFPGVGTPPGYFVLFGACSLLHNDTDANGDPLTWEIVTQPAHGHVIKVDEEFFAYQPDPDYGTQPGWLPGHTWQLDVFTYRAFDGLRYSAPAMMRFWVAAVNDPPTFTPGSALVMVDQDSGPYSAAWAADVRAGPSNESDQTVSFEITHLDVTGVPNLFAVDPAIASDGRLTFTPRAGEVGLAHVTVRAHDDGGLEDWDAPEAKADPPRDTSDAVTFDIAVMPSTNAPPVADDDIVSVMEGSGANDVAVLLGDTDPDGDDLSIIAIPTLPAHGTVTITGGGTGLTYRPATSFHGSDSFTYRIADGHGGTDTATVDVTVVKDATAPVVSAPVQRLIGQTVGSGTVKTRVAWAASDPGSGVASYAVQLSTNGAAFKTVALATRMSTWVDLVLTTGRSYQVRVRAVDLEGNTSAYVATSIFEARRYEDASTTVTYGGSWGIVRTTRALGGTTHFSATAGRIATFRFTGQDVGFVATRATTSGRAEIRIDGMLTSTIDLDRASTGYRQLVYARHLGARAAHTLEVRVLGDGRVDVDGFIVLR